MKKKIIIGVLIAAILGGGLFAIFGKGEEESPYVMVSVERGDIEERVLTTATVEAADEFELSFASAGRIDRVNVAVGDSVTLGAELAALDSAALSARIRQQRAARNSAIANLNQQIAGASNASIAILERAVDSAQIALNNANADLVDKQRTTAEDLDNAYADLLDVFRNVELSTEGAIQSINAFYNVSCSYQCLRSWGIFLNSPVYIPLLESQKVSADSALASIQSTQLASTAATSQVMLDSNAVSIQGSVATIVMLLDTAHTGFQEESDRALVQTSRLDVNANLTLLNNQLQSVAAVKSTNTTTINTAENIVRNAEAAVSSARAQLNSILEPPRAVDLASLRAGVSSAQANLDAATADLNNAILNAPVDGIITQVNIQPGEVAGSTTIAIAMVSGATYSVEANVPEADIAKITVSDHVDIELDALPGQAFEGTVIAIDPAELVIGGVVTFKVTTDIMDGISMLKPGMTADIDILTGAQTGVLFVPQRAVLDDAGSRYVRTLDANKEVTRVPVTTGIRSGDGMIEILSGLTEGQEIINFERS